MDPETEVRYDRHSLMGHETAQDRYNPNCTGRIMICICVCTYMCMFEYLYIYIYHIYMCVHMHSQEQWAYSRCMDGPVL